MKAWQSYGSAIGLILSSVTFVSGCDTDTRYDKAPEAGKAAGGSGGKAAGGAGGSGGKAAGGSGGKASGGTGGKAAGGTGGKAAGGEGGSEEDAGI